MRPLALLTVISLCAGPHAAQGGELVIGHVHLHLGMPKEEVLPALSKEFDPKLVSESEGEYLLWTRDPVSHVPMSAGRVAFKAGRLYRAAKTWAEDPHGGMATADGLFAVLAEAAGREGRECRVKAETLRAPGTPGITGTEVKLLTIELPPDRRVLLQIHRPLMSPGGFAFEPSATVEELLMELSARK